MVSIIIPVYNAARYIDKCVKSVLSQTYTNVECLLINDGSKDDSLKICQSYADKDSRVIVVNKKNEGVDKARFDGLSYAKGEFVMFVDSDDWLDKNAVYNLMKPMSELAVDMVVGMKRNVYQVGFLHIQDWRNKTSEHANKLILHKEMMDNYYLSFFDINILPVTMWATLYRRSIINEAKLQPCGLSFGEDLVFNMKLMPYVRKYYMIDKIVYNYKVDGWGFSSKYLDKWLGNARLLFDIKISQIKELHYDKAVKWLLIEFVNYLKTYVNISLLRDERHIEVRKYALETEFQKYNYWERLAPLVTIGYEDEEFLDAVQQMDVDLLFAIMHDRLLQQSIPYRIKYKTRRMRFVFLV